MKLSTIFVFAATIMGAVAEIGHPGLDLERRELDLERREIHFERRARAWLASRDVREALNPRAVCSGYCGYPTMPQCTAGCVCRRGSCVAADTPPPSPTNGKKKAAPKKGK